MSAPFDEEHSEQIVSLLQEASRLAQAGEWQDAEELCRRILEQDPGNALSLYFLSICKIQTNDNTSAIQFLKDLINIGNGDANKLSLLAKLLSEVGRTEEALPYLRQLTQLAPSPAAYNVLGAAAADTGRIGEAIQVFRRSLSLQAADNPACAGLYPLLRLACDWSDQLGALSAEIDRLNAAALAAGRPTPEPPFDNIHRVDNPAVNLAVARSWSRSLGADPELDQPLARRVTPGRTDQRIRLGYLSADLHDHATAHLSLGLFRHHDRRRFAVHAYSYGPDDGSRYRTSLREACDAFVDLRPMTDREAARKIATDDIDILVDLKGHTRRNRLSICAMRPARIQVTYLGFPGTSGADFFDYAITDATVTPAASPRYYTEKLVYLPYTYQCTDNAQKVPDPLDKKLDLFGKSDVFVYSSFNNPMKIEPEVFDIWMNILESVPNSILWVLKNNELARQNLLKRAERTGIAGSRLRFAEVLPRERHLARMALADLALDTRTYNGHTTTSDALWAGLPVITMEGRHFASRVSASLLRAAGLPELITNSPDDYRQLAIELATAPERLAAIRARVATQRLKSPLFDTARFTGELEAAYEAMWKRHCRGEAPRSFFV